MTNSQFAMEHHHAFLIGKPSISIRAIYFPWRTVSGSRDLAMLFLQRRNSASPNAETAGVTAGVFQDTLW